MKNPSNHALLLTQIAGLYLKIQSVDTLGSSLELLRDCDRLIIVARKSSNDFENSLAKNKEIQAQNNSKTNQVKVLVKKLSQSNKEREILEKQLETVNANKRNGSMKMETKYSQLLEKYEELLGKLSEVEAQKMNSTTEPQSQDTPRDQESLVQCQIWLLHNKEVIDQLQDEKTKLNLEISSLKLLYEDLNQENESLKYLVRQFSAVENTISSESQTAQTSQDQEQETPKEPVKMEQSDVQTARMENQKVKQIKTPVSEGFYDLAIPSPISFIFGF